MQTPIDRLPSLSAGLLLAGASLALLACGGSSKHPPDTTAATATSSTSSAAIAAARGRVHYGNGVAHVHPPDGPNDEQSSTGARAVKPCALVTAAEARAIVGVPIAKRVEAAQGPTCVFQTHSSKTDVTLALQATSIANAKVQLRNRMTVAVGKHHAYCGTIGGGSVLFVPLSSGSILTITASCPIASSLATKALTRLGG